LISITINFNGNTAVMLLTVPLILTPLLYRVRHSVRVERRKILLLSTATLGVSTALIGVAPLGYVLAVMGVLFTVILLSILYIINNLVSPILIVQSTSYLLTISSTIGSIISILMAYALQYFGVLGWVITGALITTSSLIYKVLKIAL